MAIAEEHYVDGVLRGPDGGAAGAGKTLVTASTAKLATPAHTRCCRARPGRYSIHGAHVSSSPPTMPVLRRSAQCPKATFRILSKANI